MLCQDNTNQTVLWGKEYISTNIFVIRRWMKELDQRDVVYLLLSTNHPTVVYNSKKKKKKGKEKKQTVCLCLRVLWSKTWTLLEVLYWSSPLVHPWPGTGSSRLQDSRHGQGLYRIQFLSKQSVVGPFTKGLEPLSAFLWSGIGKIGRLWFPGLV